MHYQRNLDFCVLLLPLLLWGDWSFKIKNNNKIYNQIPNYFHAINSISLAFYDFTDTIFIQDKKFVQENAA